MNKIPLILAILAVCNGLYVPVAQVYATETAEIQQQREVKSTVANEVLSPYIKFTMLSITENSAKVAFNQGKVETIGIRNLYFASYNHEKVTMSYADAHLSELGVKPADELKADWANVVLAARDQNLIMGAALIGGGSGSDKYLTNHPGILYHAAEIYDQTADEYYWVRGKISYRKPMYYHAAPNKMVMDCYGSIVGGKYFFESMVDQMPDNKFVPWSTEWHDDLVGDLAALEKNILAWTGDATQKTEYLTDLVRINNVAEDADDTAGLRAEVVRLEDLLEQRAQIIESGNTGGGNTGDGDQTTTGGSDNPNEGGSQTGGNGDLDNTGDSDATGNTGNAGGESSGNGGDDGSGSSSDNKDDNQSSTGTGQKPNEGSDQPNPGDDDPNQDSNKDPNQGQSTSDNNGQPTYTGSHVGTSGAHLANQNVDLGQEQGEQQSTTSTTVKTLAANTLATTMKSNSTSKSATVSKNDQRSVESSVADGTPAADSAEKVELPLEIPTLSQEEIAEKSGIWPIILTILGLGAVGAWGIWLFLIKRRKADRTTDRHF